MPGALLARAKELRPAGFRLWIFQRNERAAGSTSDTAFASWS
jgi:hypothetical protein